MVTDGPGHPDKRQWPTISLVCHGLYNITEWMRSYTTTVFLRTSRTASAVVAGRLDPRRGAMQWFGSRFCLKWKAMFRNDVCNGSASVSVEQEEKVGRILF